MTIDIKNVWEEFIKNKNDVERNKLIEYYIPFVNDIAKKVSKSINYKLSADELASDGIMGLYKAIDKFDPNRKIKFETYAYRRIRGSMIDILRENDWIPRSVRQKNSKLQKAEQSLEKTNKSKPFVSDVLKKAGIDEKDFYKNIHKYVPTQNNSIEDFSSKDENDDYTFNDIMTDKKQPYERMLSKEFKKIILGNNLSKKERQIIYYYYYEELTMKEISSKINMSESRISQIHKDVLKRIKKIMKDE